MPSFDTPEPILANIEPVVGSVRIIAGERADTVVDVRPTDESDASDVKAARQTVVEYSAGTLTVKAPRANPFDITNKTRSIEVTIELPAGSRVHGNTHMGDIRTDGRLGECRYKCGVGHVQLDHTGELHLNTGAGNIAVDRVEGNVEITTGSGWIRVGEIAGTGAVKNSNGSTTIGSVGGSLRARAANGDITVEHAEDEVDAKTANGSVRVLDAVRGTLTLETAMGDLEIGIRQGTAAWLDVNTKFGRVRNDMDDAVAPGAATNTIEARAHTSFGDIAIHRS